MRLECCLAFVSVQSLERLASVEALPLNTAPVVNIEIFKLLTFLLPTIFFKAKTNQSIHGKAKQINPWQNIAYQIAQVFKLIFFAFT